jgi:hypothetical protein
LKDRKSGILKGFSEHRVRQSPAESSGTKGGDLLCLAEMAIFSMFTRSSSARTKQPQHSGTSPIGRAAATFRSASDGFARHKRDQNAVMNTKAVFSESILRIVDCRHIFARYSSQEGRRGEPLLELCRE